MHTVPGCTSCDCRTNKTFSGILVPQWYLNGFFLLANPRFSNRIASSLPKNNMTPLETNLAQGSLYQLVYLSQGSWYLCLYHWTGGSFITLLIVVFTVRIIIFFMLLFLSLSPSITSQSSRQERRFRYLYGKILCRLILNLYTCADRYLHPAELPS